MKMKQKGGVLKLLRNSRSSSLKVKEFDIGGIGERFEEEIAFQKDASRSLC